MKRIIAFLIICLFSSSLYCQVLITEKKLEVNVICHTDNKNDKEFIISIENEDDTLIFNTKRVKFFLDYNKEYLIRFQKAGMETKIVTFSTKNITPEEWNKGFLPIDFSVKLFPASEYEYFEREVAGYTFNNLQDQFIYITHYHRLRKEFTQLNDSTYLLEEKDYKNRVIIRGYLSSANPEIRDGDFKFFNTKGELEATGEYSANVPAGIWNYYNTTGEITKMIDYDKTLNFLMNDTIDYSDKIDTKVKKNPKFQDKEAGSFDAYIEENLQFPIFYSRKEIGDEVLVSFIIDENGNTKNLKILSSRGDLDLNMEALRLISESPKLKPGESGKKAIPVLINYTIVFGKNASTKRAEKW
jgi:TonB family protein